MPPVSFCVPVPQWSILQDQGAVNFVVQASSSRNPVVGAVSSASGTSAVQNPGIPVAPIGTTPPIKNSSLMGTCSSGAIFQVTMKPQEPPIYPGKVSEDIYLWLQTVRAYFHAVAAPEEQKVGYTLTMLQDAAPEWWMQWVRN